MIKPFSEVHTHTCYCDGANTPQEMAEAAIALGMDTYGICTHGNTDFDHSYCIKDEIAFVNDVRLTAEKYSDRITILLGVERDVLGDGIDGVDYVIGSVHYVTCPDGIIRPIDMSRQGFLDIIEAYGSADAFAVDYFNSVANVAKFSPDIIGHFDLLCKYSKGEINESSPTYRQAWHDALDKMGVQNRVFEVNTGGMYRVGLSEPYPSKEILREILRRGGKVMLSSDAHATKALGYKFDEMRQLLREVGFDNVVRYKGKKLVEEGIK